MVSALEKEQTLIQRAFLQAWCTVADAVGIFMTETKPQK